MLQMDDELRMSRTKIFLRTICENMSLFAVIVCIEDYKYLLNPRQSGITSTPSCRKPMCQVVVIQRANLALPITEDFKKTLKDKYIVVLHTTL